MPKIAIIDTVTNNCNTIPRKNLIVIVAWDKHNANNSVIIAIIGIIYAETNKVNNSLRNRY